MKYSFIHGEIRPAYVDRPQYLKTWKNCKFSVESITVTAALILWVEKQACAKFPKVVRINIMIFAN